jgi:hypothetical protein
VTVTVANLEEMVKTPPTSTGTPTETMAKPQGSGLMQSIWTSVTNWGSQNEETTPESDMDQHFEKQQKMSDISGLSAAAG